MKSISDCVKYFNDSEKQSKAFESLAVNVSPTSGDFILTDRFNLITKRNLTEAFNFGLYEMLKMSLNDQIDSDMAFAWKVFASDFTPHDSLGIKDKRPGTSSTSRGSAKKIEKKSNS